MNNIQTIMLLNILMGELEIQDATIRTFQKELEKAEKKLEKMKQKVY